MLSRPALEHKLYSWAPTPYALLVFLKIFAPAVRRHKAIDRSRETVIRRFNEGAEAIDLIARCRGDNDVRVIGEGV